MITDFEMQIAISSAKTAIKDACFYRDNYLSNLRKYENTKAASENPEVKPQERYLSYKEMQDYDRLVERYQPEAVRSEALAVKSIKNLAKILEAVEEDINDTIEIPEWLKTIVFAAPQEEIIDNEQ